MPALSLDAAEGIVKVGVALLAVWLFFVGASIGSFLNVVVYRLPLGKNLVTPPSSCPVCGHAIRARHNIPILGWLSLGGRCFDCRTPISSRYPLVEALLGTVFLLLGVELVLGGSNLVDVSREPWNRLPWPTLGGAYAVHAILAATLIGAALIEFDGRRIPPSLFFPSLAMSLIWPPAFPGSRPASLWFGERGPPESVVEGAAGLLGGAGLGLLIDVVWRLCSPQRGRPRFAPAWCLAAVGAALGWRALVIVALHGTLLFALVVLGTRRQRHWKLPWPACLTIALLVVIPTYRFGTLWDGPPAATSHFVYESAVAAIVGLFALVARTTPPRYWRRAPQSFPLAHVPADAPLAERPAESPVPEPSAPEPPSPESTHDP